jgi:transposase InsO family protein
VTPDSGPAVVRVTIARTGEEVILLKGRRHSPEQIVRLWLLVPRHPRYGYRRMHALFRREGWARNRKRVQRLSRDEGLRLQSKARRRRRGRRAPGNVTAACPNQVWALDFLVTLGTCR